MLPLDVNILIKQAPWPDTYEEQLKNIAEMRELHKNIPQVIQLDPRTNILDAVMVSDMLVSEESSTMCECVMMGKPVISVYNWLIPDVTPSRFPADDYEYAIKTKKEDLTECVKEVINNYRVFAEEARNYSKEHFSNIGKSIPIMMDILDATIRKKETPYPALQPQKGDKLSFSEYRLYLIERIKREISYNYCIQSKAVAFLWNIARGIYRKCKYNG